MCFKWVKNFHVAIGLTWLYSKCKHTFSAAITTTSASSSAIYVEVYYLTRKKQKKINVVDIFYMMFKEIPNFWVHSLEVCV